ncbi:tetratricopeptide repeat protein [Rhodoferax aquaticus]|nr:tetratricopeptide repeat protein [Rhodoferax aquaticus]
MQSAPIGSYVAQELPSVPSHIDDALRAARERVLQTALEHGESYHRAGMLVEAEEFYRTILQEDPEHAQAHHRLGLLAVHAKQPEQGVLLLKKALALCPESMSFRLDLADALIQSQCLLQAWTVLNDSPDKPGYATALIPLLLDLSEAMEVSKSAGGVYAASSLKRKADKRYQALRASKTKMHEQAAATQLLAQEKFQALEALALDLLFKCPMDNFCWELFGLALFQGRGGKGADACLRRAVALAPTVAENQYNLGGVLTIQGKLQEAEDAFRSALRIDPQDALAHMNLLFCLSHNATVGAQQLFEEHRRFGEVFEAPLRKSWPKHANDRNPQRVIRVGFVSPDFRTHVVAKFILPMFERLAKDTSLTLIAYYTLATVDEVTTQIRGHFAQWNHVAGMSDEALAATILADQVDILVDLSGHTRFNRLLAFARKPAPVQVSWIGYPGTTGLTGMDYYLVDKVLCPPESPIEQQFTEKLVRLPTCGLIQPEAGLPDPGPLPALRNGGLTLGSFNRIGKITPESVALWAKLLHALPSARLLVGDVNFDDGVDLRLIASFESLGIDRQRLRLEPRRDIQGYLALHQEVDFCLDTTPYGGGTTTYHALHMGVPTLTLFGDTLTRRLGLCILTHYGCEQFAADNEQHFVEKGVYWSEHLHELAAVRASLAEKVRLHQEAQVQQQRMVDGISRAFRTMWKRWCAGLPAESFDA